MPLLQEAKDQLQQRAQLSKQQQHLLTELPDDQSPGPVWEPATQAMLFVDTFPSVRQSTDAHHVRACCLQTGRVQSAALDASWLRSLV